MTPPRKAPAEPFRIAIVMPSTITDLAWSQSMYDRLLAVREEMGGESAMEIAYSENMFNVADAAAAIRDYAAEASTWSSPTAPSTATPCSKSPPTSRRPPSPGAPRWTRARMKATRTSSPTRPMPRSGYVNGVIAALLNQSGVIGVVGPVEAGDAKLYIDGFVNGVEANAWTSR
ncbi:MAG: hypothetical protein R2851_25385 [Caldilineaceae bacterium]